MTEDRRKEIAMMLVEERLVERGIPGADELRRDLGNVAKKIGVETEELIEFYRLYLPKIIGRIFHSSKVSVEMTDY